MSIKPRADFASASRVPSRPLAQCSRCDFGSLEPRRRCVRTGETSISDDSASAQFAPRLANELTGRLGAKDDPVAVLKRYFADGFAGAEFDPSAIAGRSPQDNFGRFDRSHNIVDRVRRNTNGAITPEAIIAMQTRSEDIDPLLVHISVDRALRTMTRSEFDQMLGRGSAAERLYRLLRELGLPQVATPKLLARKRPRLLPARDSIVARRLMVGTRWHALSTQPDLVARIEDIRDQANCAHLSR
ncbi:MAG: DUF6308 family protein [Acidimicrobiales bacterium]